PPCGRGECPREEFEQRRLALTVGADDGVERAAGHRQVDAAQHLETPERFGESDRSEGDGRFLARRHAAVPSAGAAGAAGVPGPAANRSRTRARRRWARPARPLGATSTKTANTAPTTAGQYFAQCSGRAMSVASRNLMDTAPAAGPKNELRPPSMVTRTASPVVVHRSVSAATWRNRKADRPPATPQIPADHTKARSR